MGQQVAFRAVEDELARVAVACGREPRSVRLVAVSKTVGLQAVEEAVSQGACEFGENRPEMLAQKAAALPSLRWHMIGNIQSRRIPEIVRSASLIHSVCSIRHTQKIGHVAGELNKVQDILIQVNVTGEETKGGFAPDEVCEAVIEAAALEHVRVCGLMTMAPIGDEAVAREAFADLARIRRDVQDRLRQRDDMRSAAAFEELSMGMSGDWRVAVEQGATIVRIGRAVFPPCDGTTLKAGN